MIKALKGTIRKAQSDAKRIAAKVTNPNSTLRRGLRLAMHGKFRKGLKVATGRGPKKSLPKPILLSKRGK